MTAETIAATLREAVRAIKPPMQVESFDVLPFNRRLINAKCAIGKAAQANSFEGSMSGALAVVVALEGAEAEAKRAVEYWQRHHAALVHNAAQAREALRAALADCGDPGAATAEADHHTATLRRNSASKVEITDEAKLPAVMLRIKSEPDKALIKATLARGQEVPGAVLISTPPSLVITAKEA